MNKTISIVSILIAFLFFSSCSKEEELQVSEIQKEEMRTTASEFMKQLKAVLIDQIHEHGVIGAITVCSDTAQILTDDFNLQRGTFLRRVSFKNRNSKNYPDKYEEKILSKFEMMHSNKELDESTEHIELVKENEFAYLRYLKPIVVQSECLNCHGKEKDLTEIVRVIIAEVYPDDKAVNYALGDLRGAVSIKKLID